ncbi:MAG: hypothetical protein ACRC92_25885 [Peptostreptococcaceae bacterium]
MSYSFGSSTKVKGQKEYVLVEYLYDKSEYNLQDKRFGHRAKIELLLNLLFKEKGGLPDPECGVELNKRRHMLLTASNIVGFSNELTTQVNTYLPNMFSSVDVYLSSRHKDAIEIMITVDSENVAIINSDEGTGVYSVYN